MPLTRATVTVASRIMLPTYVALFTVLGVNYTFTTSARLSQSPALDYADRLIPLPVWGLVFFACAVLMLAALVTARRVLFEYALWVAIIALGVWTIVFTAAALFAQASPTAGAWPAFTATACFASYRSLSARETR